MGKAALTSHAGGNKHKQNVKRHEDEQRTALPITSFLKQGTSSTSASGNCASTSSSGMTGTRNSSAKSQAQASLACSSSSEPSSSSSTSSTATSVSSSKVNTSGGPMGQFVSTTATLKVEILWVMRQVTNHQSLRSSTATDALFRTMFPDSKIAQTFQCSRTKASYLSTFGISPHFKRLLVKNVKNGPYVLLFDESLNLKTHTKQMDIFTRFWMGDQITSRFYTSSYMGRATAEIMQEKFLAATNDLAWKDLLQVSMDGPNVNWKFYKNLQKEMKKSTSKVLLNVGSCGLHVVHGAFKRGVDASGWNVDQFLRSSYWLFKDTPARRDEFSKVVKKPEPAQPTYPLKFYGRKTHQSQKGRILEVLPDFKKYVRAEQKKDTPHPHTKTFEAVKEGCDSKLLPAKLYFYISVAKEIKPFLILYQTDKPMIPFLVTDLYSMLKSLMSRFTKSDVMKKCTSAQKLASMDVSKKDNLLPSSKVYLGFNAQRKLQEVAKDVSERQQLEFKSDCRNFLQGTVIKLLEKSPIIYSLARCLTCLDPRKMANTNQAESCTIKMSLILKSLIEYNWLQESECEEIQREYKMLIQEHASSQTFQAFDPSSSTCRVDTFLMESMNVASYKKLWKVVSMLLLISHGQASVERGFSVNREVERDNLSEESNTAERTICDHVASVGGIFNVEMSNALLMSASSARQKYVAFLDDQKKAKETEAQQQKRKHMLDELEDLKKKRQCLQGDIKGLEKSADDFADKAEHTRQFVLITKSNTMRRRAKEKIAELEIVNEKIDSKLVEIRNN